MAGFSRSGTSPAKTSKIYSQPMSSISHRWLLLLLLNVLGNAFFLIKLQPEYYVDRVRKVPQHVYKLNAIVDTAYNWFHDPSTMRMTFSVWEKNKLEDASSKNKLDATREANLFTATFSSINKDKIRPEGEYRLLLENKRLNFLKEPYSAQVDFR